MSTLTLDRTVGELVTERPDRARVFETFGIDYCCGGKKPLAKACQDNNLNPNQVLGMLKIVDDQSATQTQERDWSKATMTELADHIEATHHAYLKSELPRLLPIVEKVAYRHGPNDARLVEIRNVFIAFQEELSSHMYKEEKILFPLIREMEEATGPIRAHCGSVQNPIRVMIMEHDSAGDALARMRELTDGFTPPAHACTTYRAMLDGLERIEQDMHRHVHKENSILFPKAVELESSLAARR